MAIRSLYREPGLLPPEQFLAGVISRRVSGAECTRMLMHAQQASAGQISEVWTELDRFVVGFRSVGLLNLLLKVDVEGRARPHTRLRIPIGTGSLVQEAHRTPAGSRGAAEDPDSHGHNDHRTTADTFTLAESLHLLYTQDLSSPTRVLQAI